MKYLVFIILLGSYLFKSDYLSNSIWTCKISQHASDTLRFKPNQQVDDYDCEIPYTFHGSYLVRKDIVIITAKDDSHSEDNGKVSYYRQTFKINKNILCPLFNEDLIHNKWVKSSMQMEPGYIFKKIK